MDITINNDEVIRLAVEASPNGMVMINEQGRIVLVNTAIESMFGYQRNELLQQPIEVLVPNRYRTQHPVMRGHFFKAPQSRAMGQGRELFAQHKNGTEFPVEIGLNPIAIKSGVLVLASVVDITERYRAQEMMNLAVEAAPNGMLLTDFDGNIVLINSMAEMQFGYSREELMGQSLSILIPERFREHHPHLREEYLKNPVSRTMGKGRDLYAVHKNGHEFAVEIGLNPINTIQGLMILASVVDITERKQQEQQLKSALNEKEVMLSEIHHRVKNNLQIIDSLIGMQLDSITDPQAQMMLADSRNRIKSMAIIHQTLYQSSDLSSVDVASVLSNLTSNLAHSYGQSRIRIQVDADRIQLPIESSIPLGLIVNELVSNSFKHAFPDDRKRGLIEVILHAIGREKAELKVVDNGIGIDEDSLSGDSLGLRLVEALSDQLEGSLQINHREPTCFTLEFAIPEYNGAF